MGLDLIVEGCAKPGHEPEWLGTVERAFSDEELSAEEIERFSEISIPAYERLGAPRVGYDKAADDWIVKVRKAETPDEVAAVLKDFHGHYALELVSSDRLPRYRPGGYEGVDETTFRGQFLAHCEDVLRKELIDKAWNHKLPDAAAAYGRELLAAAEAAAKAGAPPEPKPRRGLLSWLGGAKKGSELSFDEQLDVVQAAGRWFVFWGERGHPIRAWY